MNVIQIIALVLFLIMYALMLVFSEKRPYITSGAAIIFIILMIVNFSTNQDHTFWEAVNATGVQAFTDFSSWNVLLMIAGTMGVVAFFIESKMPSLMADVIINKVPNVKWAIVGLSLFSGLVSAFIDNVATVLMVAPVALTVCKKLKINPVPSIIAIAISSNLQGAATLVGDTTSILLAQQTNMNFVDFFWMNGKPNLFFIVQAGALASAFVLLFVFRKYTQPLEQVEKTKVKDYFPSFLLLGIIVALIIASFFTIPVPWLDSMKNGIICITIFLIGFIRKLIKTKDDKKEVTKEAVKSLDFETLILLFGLFIVVGGLGALGIIGKIGEAFNSIANSLNMSPNATIFVLYTIIVFISVIISAFVDNIPYVMTMLPVITALLPGLGLAPGDNKAYLLYFGLLIGATLGGNITPVGASANITGIGMLRREGHEVKTGTFMKISVPFTLVAVLTGWVLCFLIWGL